MTSAVVVAVAVLAGLSMAWAVGANSNSPPFAPAVAANALPTMRAAFFIGILAGTGAVLQGGNISDTIGNDLILNVQVTPLAAAAALLVAAASIAIGVGTGYPIPAAFSTTGAVVGVGLALGGAPAFDQYVRIASFWAMVPPVAGSIAYTTATILRRDDVPEEVGVPLLGAVCGLVVANMSLSLLPVRGDVEPTLARLASQSVGVETPTFFEGYDLVMLVATLGVGVVGFLVLRRAMIGSVDRGIRRFLVGLGALVAFSSGGSQVGLATGPLETLFSTEFTVPAAVPIASGTLLLTLGGTGILAGAWTGAPRLLQAVAREYSTLGVRRSIAALVPGFIIAQTAITLGIPISFNNIVISSVIGSGLVEGSAGVSRRKIAVTIVGWLSTLVAAIGVGYLLYTGLAAVVGG